MAKQSKLIVQSPVFSEEAEAVPVRSTRAPAELFENENGVRYMLHSHQISA